MLGSVGEIQHRREPQSVEVLGVDDGGAGLEGVAADGDGGHAAADDAAALEDSDVLDAVGVGPVAVARVVFDEMSE